MHEDGLGVVEVDGLLGVGLVLVVELEVLVVDRASLVDDKAVLVEAEALELGAG